MKYPKGIHRITIWGIRKNHESKTACNL